MGMGMCPKMSMLVCVVAGFQLVLLDHLSITNSVDSAAHNTTDRHTMLK